MTAFWINAFCAVAVALNVAVLDSPPTRFCFALAAVGYGFLAGYALQAHCP